MTRTHCVEYQSRPTHLDAWRTYRTEWVDEARALQALRRLSKPRFRGAHLIVRNPEEGQA